MPTILIPLVQAGKWKKGLVKYFGENCLKSELAHKGMEAFDTKDPTQEPRKIEMQNSRPGAKEAAGGEVAGPLGRRGSTSTINCSKPIPPLGNHTSNILQKCSLGKVYIN